MRTAFADYKTPPFYDSVVAKLTTDGANYDGNSSRARRALEEHRPLGMETTTPLHIRLMDGEAFLLG